MFMQARAAAPDGLRMRRRLIAIVGLAAILAALVAVALTEPARGNAVDVAVIHNVAYGTQPGEQMEIFADRSGVAHPAVIMIHGGGWSGGDELGIGAEAGQLAAAGFVVFNVDYTLDSATQPGFAIEAENVITATRWVALHAARYGGDTAHLTLLGGSSGATLAAWAGERLDAETPGVVRSVISLSGRTDFENFEQDLGGGITPGFDPAVNIPRYLGCTFGACPRTLERAASPIDRIAATCPSFLLFNSEAENMPLDQAQTMHAALQAHGCAARLEIVPGDGHAFAYYDQVQSEIESFLAAQT